MSIPCWLTGRDFFLGRVDNLETPESDEGESLVGVLPEVGEPRLRRKRESGSGFRNSSRIHDGVVGVDGSSGGGEGRIHRWLWGRGSGVRESLIAFSLRRNASVHLCVCRIIV